MSLSNRGVYRMINLHRQASAGAIFADCLARVLHSNPQDYQAGHWYIVCANENSESEIHSGSQRLFTIGASVKDFDESLISHTLEHRGCGIRAASYEVCPRAWLPEACVWLRTETGQRRLWVQSFVHCFTAEQLTFPDRLAADSWAFVAAKLIIDRALPEPNSASPFFPHSRARHLSHIWRMARTSISSLGHLRRSRPRH
jgi:hypothetical protein